MVTFDTRCIQILIEEGEPNTNITAGLPKKGFVSSADVSTGTYIPVFCIKNCYAG